MVVVQTQGLGAVRLYFKKQQYCKRIAYSNYVCKQGGQYGKA